MRNYYPLVIGGAAIMLLTSQPLQAKANPTSEEQSNSLSLEGETVEALNNFSQQLTDSEIQSSALEFTNQPLKLDTQQVVSKLSTKALEIATATDSQDRLFKPLFETAGEQRGRGAEEKMIKGAIKANLELKGAVIETEPTDAVETDPLMAQTLNPPPTVPVSPSGVVVPQPEIIIKDNGISNPNGISDPNNLQPQTPASPFLPRAVAPPVGDMAISNIDASSEMIDLGTSAIVPRLVLRQAPAREVLGVLARYAGLNLVFTDEGQPTGEQGAAPALPATVSLDLENETVQEVFNSVLMISGLTANRRGRTIFVGSNLPNGARNLISRTLRLNQVQAINAATFLATQGAGYQRVVISTEDIIDPVTQRVVRRVERPAELLPLAVTPPEGGTTAPLLLSGLTVAADDRLNSITLIGDPRQVQVATSLLTQLDARRRQVVINVKVIDVNLRNLQDFNSSFSFGIGDTFVSQDNGAAIINFGNRQPPNTSQVQGSTFFPTVVPFNTTIPGGTGIDLVPFFDIQNGPFSAINRGLEEFTNNIIPYARPNFGTFNNPFQPGLTDVNIDPATGQIEYEYSLPELFQFPQRFLLNLQAQIQSGNAKILTDPSLVVQEGQEATVKLTQKVLESVQTSVDPLSGVRTITPILADSGLTLTVDIAKVDDNGFVNLSVSPTVASPSGATVEFDSGDDAVNTLTLLSRRELSSGLVRLRDGQTLILSGIIQESDRATVSKVPILGDIPLLGALFRSTSSESLRTEVIILLTPQIMDDNQNSGFGFNYTPGQDAAEILKKQGFPVQTP